MDMLKRIGILIFCMNLLCTQAQHSCYGTDFLFAFPYPNYNPSTNPDSAYHHYISIKSIYDTDGYIYFNATQDSIPFHIQAFHSYEHTLTDTQKSYSTVGNRPRPQDIGVYNSGIHITSSYPITISIGIHCTASSEVSVIVPTPAWGYSYITHNTKNITPYYGIPESILIIANEDSTLIYSNNAYICTINKGEIWYDHVSIGTKISANKPIMVYSFNSLATIKSSGDGILEPMLPLHSLGTDVFVPCTPITTNYIQVIATQNHTNITYSGGNIITDFSGFRIFEIDTNAARTTTNLMEGEKIWITVDRYDHGCYIHADKPISVHSFLSQGDDSIGDPEMAAMPGINQKTTDCIIKPFQIPDDPQYLPFKHYLTISTPTLTKDSTRIRTLTHGDTCLYGGTWTNHSSGYSFYNMPVQADTNTYYISNNAGGIIAYYSAFKHADGIYALANCKFFNADISFTGNDTSYINLSEVWFCEQNIHFTADIKGNMSPLPGHIKWYIDGTEYLPARDNMQWSKYFSQGTYHIEMEVRFDDEINTKRIGSTLNVSALSIETTTTPEHCHKEDGCIMLYPTVCYQPHLLYRTDSTWHHGDTIYGLKAGNYHLYITDSVCETEADVRVDSTVKPQAEFSADYYTTMAQYTIHFTDRSTYKDAPIDQWYWDYGDNKSSTLQHPSHAYEHEGNYPVTLYITDTNLCVDSITHYIDIVSAFSFPNIFTPTGADGKSYYFRPIEDKGLFHSFEMTIYNRWGTPVWTQHCSDGACPHYTDDSFWWNGISDKGVRVSDGVYYWVVTVHTPGMPTFSLHGSVTVAGSSH